MPSITMDEPQGNGTHWTIKQKGSEKKTHFVNYLQVIVFDRKDRESHNLAGTKTKELKTIPIKKNTDRPMRLYGVTFVILQISC